MTTKIFSGAELAKAGLGVQRHAHTPEQLLIASTFAIPSASNYTILSATNDANTASTAGSFYVSATTATSATNDAKTNYNLFISNSSLASTVTVGAIVAPEVKAGDMIYIQPTGTAGMTCVAAGSVLFDAAVDGQIRARMFTTGTAQGLCSISALSFNAVRFN